MAFGGEKGARTTSLPTLCYGLDGSKEGIVRSQKPILVLRLTSTDLANSCRLSVSQMASRYHTSSTQDVAVRE